MARREDAALALLEQWARETLHVTWSCLPYTELADLVLHILDGWGNDAQGSRNIKRATVRRIKAFVKSDAHAHVSGSHRRNARAKWVPWTPVATHYPS